MSRFKKLAHVLWHCQYHIVFVSKYRYRILKGGLGKSVYQSIRVQTERAGCEIVELNVQLDHVHLLVKIPPKLPVSSLVGQVKGKTAILMFQKYPDLRTKRYWGNHFWSVGYCVDTVGMDTEMIKKYVKYQDKK